LTDIDKTAEYYEFFDKFMFDWLEAGKNIGISRYCDPTLVVPYEYTQEHGKDFYQLLLNQIELQSKKYKAISQPESNYFNRFRSKLPFYKEFFTKHRMFTCSAGDSQVGLGDIPSTIHSCHRTFYLDHEEYIQAAEEYGLDELTMEGIAVGRSDVLADSHITNIKDESKLIKTLYTNRAHHDFAKHRISSGVASVLELAHAGQISKCYKDPQMALLLSYFSQVLDCPMDNVSLTGSTIIKPIPMFRIFGNGVFENILSRILKDSRYI